MSAAIAAMTVRTVATTRTTTLVSSPDTTLRFSAETQMPPAFPIRPRTSFTETAGAGGLGGEMRGGGRTLRPAIDDPQMAQTAAVMLLAALQVRHILVRAYEVDGAPGGQTACAGAAACGVVGHRLVGGGFDGAAGELADGDGAAACGMVRRRLVGGGFDGEAGEIADGDGATALGGISCRTASRSGTFSKGRAQYSSRRSASLATAWSGELFSRPKISEPRGSA